MPTARSGPSRSSASTSWTASRGPRGRAAPGRRARPVAQTSSTIPLDLVNNIVRRPYADRLRLIIGELGAGLAGRPDDLSEVLRRAHPGPARDHPDAADTGPPDPDHRARRDSSRHRRRRAGAAARRRDALRARGGRHRRRGGHAQRRARRRVRPAPALPGRARSVHGAAGPARHRAAARSAEPARRRRPGLDTFLARLPPFAEAAARRSRRSARPSVVGPPRGARDERGARRAARAWPRRRPASPSRCGSCSSPSTTASGP